MQSPTNTTIISAVDGNEISVTNDVFTPSTSITFTVQAIPGTNPISYFQYSLDGGPLTNLYPHTQNGITLPFNLTPGQHVIQIRTMDSQNYPDPIPAVFSWFIEMQQ